MEGRGLKFIPAIARRLLGHLSMFEPMVGTSLTWPDPIFAQGRYRLQCKCPARKGSGPVHRPDWNRDHHRGGGC